MHGGGVGVEFCLVAALELVPARVGVGVVPLTQVGRRRYVLDPQVIMEFFF